MADRFESLRLIGNELHFDGELVAILTTNAAASHRGRFEDMLVHGEEVEGTEECKCPPRLHNEDCAYHKTEDGAPKDDKQILDELWSSATDSAKGGLLRMPDLANIVTRLKRDTA